MSATDELLEKLRMLKYDYDSMSTSLEDAIDDIAYELEQAIAATLGSGTCEMEWVSDWMGWHCKACDSLRQGLPDQKPNYCPNCGAKEVEQ